MEYTNIWTCEQYTCIKSSKNYTLAKIQTIDNDDTSACVRLLTHRNNYANCDEERIRRGLEYSDIVLYLHTTSSTDEVVAFALIKYRSKRKGKILDIRLLCATESPTEEQFGQRMIHAVCMYAAANDYRFLYVSPQTPTLRITYIQYGFESIYGIEAVNELLEKEFEWDRTQLTNLYKK
jgi:hypothetical protein